MPTPIVYKGQLYVLGNDGIFDAYNLADRRRSLPAAADERRQRVQRLAGGGRREDLCVERRRRHIVVSAGAEFKQIAINPMGELLMATPALSEGVMYVRTAKSLFAVGRPASK